MTKNTQLSHIFSHSYVFRHYRVVLMKLVINFLPSYKSISNAAVGNTIYNEYVSRSYYASSLVIVFEI